MFNSFQGFSDRNLILSVLNSKTVLGTGSGYRVTRAISKYSVQLTNKMISIFLN